MNVTSYADIAEQIAALQTQIAILTAQNQAPAQPVPVAVQKRRTYEIPFKVKVAAEYIAGKKGVEVASKYDIAPSLVYKWANAITEALADKRGQTV